MSHWNRLLVGIGRSSWRSADSRYGYGAKELRCKDENPIQRADAAVPAHGDANSGQTQHHRLDGLRLTRLRGGPSKRAGQGLDKLRGAWQ